jgi:dihydroorotase
VNTVQYPYDMVLSGGTVIDPATGLNGRYDVAVAGGKIAAVAPDLSQRA